MNLHSIMSSILFFESIVYSIRSQYSEYCQRTTLFCHLSTVLVRFALYYLRYICSIRACAYSGGSYLKKSNFSEYEHNTAA